MIFGIMKEGSLLLNTLSIIISCAEPLSNGANDISEMVDILCRFLSKRSKFCVIWMI